MSAPEVANWPPEWILVELMNSKPSEGGLHQTKGTPNGCAPHVPADKPAQVIGKHPGSSPPSWKLQATAR